MRKCYLIIVYLGIIVPIYLKHCAIGPYFGTHILTTIILGHTKMCIFSLLSIYWPATLGTKIPHVIFALPSFLLFFFFLPSSPSLKFLYKSIETSLEISRNQAFGSYKHLLKILEDISSLHFLHSQARSKREQAMKSC